MVRWKVYKNLSSRDNHMYQIKVNNLPRWISDLHLKQHFANCGVVYSAKIALDLNAPIPLGHGYVTFTNQEALKKALLMNGSKLDGAYITVKAVDSIDAILEIEQEELEELA